MEFIFLCQWRVAPIVRHMSFSRERAALVADGSGLFLHIYIWFALHLHFCLSHSFDSTPRAVCPAAASPRDCRLQGDGFSISFNERNWGMGTDYSFSNASSARDVAGIVRNLLLGAAGGDSTMMLTRRLAQQGVAFDAALAAARDTPLVSPCYFILGGTAAPQGAVVTRWSNHADVRTLGDGHGGDDDWCGWRVLCARALSRPPASSVPPTPKTAAFGLLLAGPLKGRVVTLPCDPHTSGLPARRRFVLQTNYDWCVVVPPPTSGARDARVSLDIASHLCFL